jgi:hypothetical protein
VGRSYRQFDQAHFWQGAQELVEIDAKTFARPSELLIAISQMFAAL